MYLIDLWFHLTVQDVSVTMDIVGWEWRGDALQCTFVTLFFFFLSWALTKVGIISFKHKNIISFLNI